MITKEVKEYATKNRSEFVACTATKLISEGKTWSDFNPKIEKLYKMFRGPKLNLGETKVANSH